MMTDRQADIAFVLEGVAGVLEVCALDGGSGPGGGFAFAVRLEHGAATVARAHYALLRVLTHEECRAVLYCEVDLPPGLRKRATPLVLSDAEREAARARVPLTSAALEQAPASLVGPLPAGTQSLRILIVDDDVEVHRAVVAAFGAGGERVVEADPGEAFSRARSESFDIVICDARRAFAGNGFLRMLSVADPVAASRVVVVAEEDERDAVMADLDKLSCWSSVLCKPLEVDALREILRTGAVIQVWRIPVVPARGPARPAATTPAATTPATPPLGSARRTVARVLVVDDDPTTHMLLASMRGGAIEWSVTSDEWEALDFIAAGSPDIVVCSPSMKTVGGTPFYRLLWNAHPELKRRFVFIAKADAAPASTSSGRAPAVVERPLTRERIAELVERFSAG